VNSDQHEGRESLRTALETELDGARPDFDGVLGRMARGDAVWEEHVDLGEPPAELAEACDALRARIEGRLVARLEEPSVAPAFERRRAWVWAAAIAIAAAVVLGILLDPLAVVRGEQQWHEDSSNLAVDEADTRQTAGQAQQAPSQVVQPRKTPATAPRPEPEPEVTVEPKPAVLEEPPEPVAPKHPAVRRSVSERLAELDTRAQARWSAGDVEGARRDFRSIVKLGGRRTQVQLAYAELFALARQRGEDLSSLWREYLRKFPKGRYAPEASAGLCRSTPVADRDACWERHRARFSGGGTE